MRWRWLLFRRVFPHLLLRAGAEQISVTKGIIDAANGGAVFIGLLVTRWRTSLLPAIGMRPVISHDGRRGMGWVHQRVIILRPDAITDLFDLCRNRQHGIAKPVNLRQRF